MRPIPDGGREYLEDGLKVLTMAGRTVDDAILPVKEW